MSEAAPLLPRRDDPRFPQRPTVVHPGKVIFGTPVRTEQTKSISDEQEESPKERAAREKAHRTVLKAGGKLPPTPEQPTILQAGGAGAPGGGRRKKRS